MYFTIITGYQYYSSLYNLLWILIVFFLFWSLNVFFIDCIILCAVIFLVYELMVPYLCIILRFKGFNHILKLNSKLI